MAELRSSLGLLEPFECLFVLDVMERSLRDVLALVPSRQWKGDIPLYVPYVKEEVSVLRTSELYFILALINIQYSCESCYMDEQK